MPQIPSVLQISVSAAYKKYTAAITWFNLDLVDSSYMVCAFPTYNYFKGLVIYTLTPVMAAGVLGLVGLGLLHYYRDLPDARAIVVDRLFGNFLFLTFLSFSGIATKLCQFYSTCGAWKRGATTS